MRKPRRISTLNHFFVTLLGVGAGVIRFLACVFRSRSTLIAENLFLRKQLAFYQEREGGIPHSFRCRDLPEQRSSVHKKRLHRHC